MMKFLCVRWYSTSGVWTRNSEISALCCKKSGQIDKQGEKVAPEVQLIGKR